MNRETMVTEVRQRLGEDIEDFWKTDHIVRMLNEGIRRFAMEEKWHWLYTLDTGIPVAQGATVIPLTDEVSVNRHFALLLDDGSGHVVAPRRVSAGDGARMRTIGRTGQPNFYFVAGSTLGTQSIYLVPPADQAYTAEYFYIRTPVEMVDDTDEPDIPLNYHEGIVAWAAGMLWLKELNGGPKAQEQFVMYREVLEQARRDHQRLSMDESIVWGREDPLPRVMTPRDFYERHLPQNI